LGEYLGKRNRLKERAHLYKWFKNIGIIHVPKNF
jgi:hypothetical protein